MKLYSDLLHPYKERMLDSSGLYKEETLISAPVIPHCVALQVQKRSTRLVFDRKTTRTEFIESDGGEGG